MQRFYDKILDNFGNPASGVTVTVTVASSGVAATLYNAIEDTLTPSGVISNPLVTGADGGVSFAVVNGRYKIAYQGSNITPKTINWLTMDDASGYQPMLNGTGFVKATGTTITYDNSTYLTTASAASTYAPLASPTFTTAAAFSFLTSGRIPYASTGGALVDSANLIFNGSALTLTGTPTFNATDLYLNGAAGNTRARVSGVAGTERGMILLTSGSVRWDFIADSGSESGSDAGSSLLIRARSDAGTTIDSPLQISRAAGTYIYMNRPVSCSNATASTSTTTGALVVTGGVGVGGKVWASDGYFNTSLVHIGLLTTLGASGNAGHTVVLNSATANTIYLSYRTANVNRWLVGTDGGAETGSDAGTNYIIAARTDAGAALDIPITITRAAGGAITLARPLKLPVYAFASLPTGSAGMKAFVNNNSAAPAWGSAANGSGATTVPVFHDGTSWKVG